MAYTSEAKGRELTTVIREALNAFDVVGAAAAIVHHDAVLISDGLGVRDLDSGMAADQDTLYQMGRKTPGFSRGDISPLAREGQHVPPSAGQFVARMWPPAGLGIRMMAAIDHMCVNRGGRAAWSSGAAIGSGWTPRPRWTGGSPRLWGTPAASRIRRWP